MSLSELIVAIIIGFLFLKVEDFSEILKMFRSLYKYFLSLKKEILKELSDIIEEEEDNSEKINYYLKKIAELDGKFEGDYELEQVKAFYHKLLFKSNIHKISKKSKK